MFYPSELEAVMKAVKERFDQQEKRILALEQPGSKNPYRITWLEQRIGILEGRIADMEQQVANQAAGLKNLGNLNVALQQDVALKSQAAQQQAQGNINCDRPLRSDTKPLIEMAVFVRKVANTFSHDQDKWLGANEELKCLALEAQTILKRST